MRVLEPTKLNLTPCIQVLRSEGLRPQRLPTARGSHTQIISKPLRMRVGEMLQRQAGLHLLASSGLIRARRHQRRRLPEEEDHS